MGFASLVYDTPSDQLPLTEFFRASKLCSAYLGSSTVVSIILEKEMQFFLYLFSFELVTVRRPGLHEPLNQTLRVLPYSCHFIELFFQVLLRRSNLTEQVDNFSRGENSAQINVTGSVSKPPAIASKYHTFSMV